MRPLQGNGTNIGWVLYPYSRLAVPYHGTSNGIIIIHLISIGFRLVGWSSASSDIDSSRSKGGDDQIRPAMKMRTLSTKAPNDSRCRTKEEFKNWSLNLDPGTRAE